jgi:ABC-type amino acid transport substrate-binding protein
MLLFPLLLNIPSYADEFDSDVSSVKLKSIITDTNNGTAKGNNIILGVANEIQGSYCIMNKVASAIGAEMGRTISLKLIPAKRLSKLVEKGLIHGDFARTEVYATLIPSAFKIKNAIVKLPYYAYGLNPETKVINDWDSLKKYKVVLPRGYSFTEQKMRGQELHILNSLNASFQFIKVGRADLTVTDVISASYLIENASPEFDTIKKIGSPLAVFEVNTYISSKYPELVNNYNQALGNLKQTEGYANLMSRDGC